MKKQKSINSVGSRNAVILWAVFLLIILIPGLSTADTYEYDELNRLTRVVYDDGKELTYTYDAAGNITATNDAGDIENKGGGGGGACFITATTYGGLPVEKNRLFILLFCFGIVGFAGWIWRRI